jgi:hypothetical protein
MTRRRGIACGVRGRQVRGFALAGLLLLCGALAGMPAQAFEPPPGSKNFTPPSSVPNYFSNEAAPFARGSRVAQPGADRFNTAPIAAGRNHVAVSPPTRKVAASAGRGKHRGKLARGKSARVKFVSSETGRAYVRNARGRTALVRRSAPAASRKSVATRQRVAASRLRHAARTVRHAGRALR